MTSRPETALTIALRSMIADEALASSEIEGIVLTPRDRFITKCKMIWPDLSEKDVGAAYDCMEKERAA